ncbi:MAG: hypothetical protein HGA98_02605 [Deltaproteobacteria bacterium]|nr:hypothetical protein [Deltaproteobacteria bacterium]
MQISEELKAYLDSVSFAALCTELDLGHGPEAVLVVKSTEDALTALRDHGARVELGWVVEATDAGPVVCLVLRARAEGVGDLVGEIYFDPSSAEDRETLSRFQRQDAVRAVFLDEESAAVWTASVAWDEIRKLEAEQVDDRAEELLERAEHVDFDEARAAFQGSVPLEALLARAFGDD